MGLPTVVSDIDGCTDVVLDGKTGILVTPKDPEHLTHALCVYLEDAELRRRHGIAARERVLRDFQPEPIWEAIHAAYLKLHKQSELNESDLSVAPAHR